MRTATSMPCSTARVKGRARFRTAFGWRHAKCGQTLLERPLRRGTLQELSADIASAQVCAAFTGDLGPITPQLRPVSSFDPVLEVRQCLVGPAYLLAPDGEAHDINPTKLIEVVEIGKQMLMTRGSLTTFSIASDVAKYLAIIPAAFATTLK